jgi:hypothetical protein
VEKPRVPTRIRTAALGEPPFSGLMGGETQKRVSLGEVGTPGIGPAAAGWITLLGETKGGLRRPSLPF